MQENETLTSKQLKAILALLTERTMQDAAKKSGVSETTLWRWMQEPEFQSAYRQARRSVVEKAIGELQAACSEAVKTLHRNLSCGVASTEVTAAKIILEQATKGVELIDLQERLESLEQLLEAAAQRKGKAA